MVRGRGVHMPVKKLPVHSVLTRASEKKGGRVGQEQGMAATTRLCSSVVAPGAESPAPRK